MAFGKFTRFAGPAALLSVAMVGTATVYATRASLATASSDESAGRTLSDAQRLFYSARYAEAAALASSLTPDTDEAQLAVQEMRSTALLFEFRQQMNRMSASAPKRSSPADTLKRCDECQQILADFTEVIANGQKQARAVLEHTPDNQEALFLLGKLDLNILWLQLGTLGKRTGWNEFWEARHSLTHLLEINPKHVRGRVAFAWVEYIIDTRLPWGTEWIFGGGDKKKALASIRQAADDESEFFTQAEAEFALWEMLVNEKRHDEAVGVARRLAVRFPDNADLDRFLKTTFTPAKTR